MSKALAIMLIVVYVSPIVLAQELPLVLNHDIDFMKVSAPDKVDSTELVRYLSRLKLKLVAKGHLAASMQFQQSSELWIAAVQVGPKYKGGHFEYAGDDVDLPTKSVRDLAELHHYLDERLTRLANKGYPFANLQFDDVEIEEGVFRGKINIKKGPLVYFDTLQIVGYDKVDIETLSVLTQIEPGEPYSDLRVKNLEASLGALQIIELVASPKVVFKQNKCKISLTLKKRGASSADGLVGILTNQEEKVTVIGHINLDLKNILGKAAGLKVAWARLQPETQNLSINVNTAVLFGTPLSAAGSFGLYKQDSSFLNYNIKLGLSKRIQGASAWATVFSERTASQIIVDQPSESELSDLKIDFVGIGVYSGRATNLERELNIYSNAEIAFGRKTSGGTNSSKLRIEHAIDWSVPLWKKFGLNWSLSSSIMLNRSLRTNELFRVGGEGQLRGFDPNSFYTNYYHLSNLEFRYYANSRSHFFIFHDQGFVRSKAEPHLLIPAGAGLGASLDLEAGRLSLTYAAGFFKGSENGLANPKFHINYRALF